MSTRSKMNEDVFGDLFVLELARNHWGSVGRGCSIIKRYAAVVREAGVKACIKLQFFDVDTFVHPAFLDVTVDDENQQNPGSVTRYIKKTLATRLTADACYDLLAMIKEEGLLTMVTPYDEASVALCEQFENVDMMKLASSDTGCLPLVERVIDLGKPLAISTGAVNKDHIDRVVTMAEGAGIPLAINQCVSNYPTDDRDLQLAQIAYWRDWYGETATIGFSSHDFTDITRSHIMAYALGARTFERHIDVDFGDKKVTPYCITPDIAAKWFAAHKVAVAMLGDQAESVREMTKIEKGYLASVNRGVYALRDLPKGYSFDYTKLGEDYYLAIPLQDGQLSSSQLDMELVLQQPVSKDSAILLR